MLLGTLGENLSGNNLADTGMNRSAEIFLRTG